ncbi:uncharacterized protein LOC133795999 [Humulus lupulus]|uniref:uncharacterized protein LOC133795999 n=1 Tax=Humulus lupulus TaxID=3486 RepID=UPI002B402418|nr:uncharacterized protein LOC133795999 [Humulus lupulus]
MAIASWNAKGLNGEEAMRQLRFLIKNNRPEVIFLMETKLTKDKVATMCKQLSYDNGFEVPRIGLGGGGFYGHPAVSNRHMTWELLQHLRIVAHGPWLVMGDFNEVLSQADKNGGGLRNEHQIEAFRNTLEERLDWAMVNEEWKDSFTSASLTHLDFYHSDHRALLLRLQDENGYDLLRNRKRPRFKFENIWSNETECKEIIKKCWKPFSSSSSLLATMSIFNEGNEWCTSDSEISEITMKFYNSLFTSSSPSKEKIEELLQGVHTSVSDEMNMSLEAPFSLEEIKDAVFSMPADKSPGPDEGFSALLQQAESRKEIKGLRLANTAPFITHLFFADDSLIIVQASERSLQAIQNIFSLYSTCSGQMINFTKSLLYFSPNTSKEIATLYTSSLNMQRTDSTETYLGLPMLGGKNKRILFNSIKDKVWMKLHLWQSKLFSQAGKEILLKAVIQAMPTYLMSCFRIPEGLCQEIERIQARYWWGSTTEQKKIHWRAWHKMCRPKCEGGLGFRGFIQYNQALLAKQAWRLLINPTSLLAKVLKARYYQHTSILEAREGHYPSITWRSIIWGRDLLRRGLRRRIGNGKETLAFSDPWVPRPPSFLPSIIDISDPLRVHDLFETPGSWNMIRVQQFFNAADAQNILTIPLTQFDHPDSWLWHYTNHGNYTIKSGYNLASAMDTALPSSSVTLIAMWWKYFWGIKIPRKILHFAWRGYHEIFPTLKGLNRRNISKHSVCPLCGFGEDSNAHVVFWCPSSKEIWDRWDYPFVSDRKEDISFKEILLYASEILEKENFQKMLIIAWAIWFERNKRTHGHPARQGQQVFEWTETIGFGAIILSPEKEVIAPLSKPLKGMLLAFQAEAIAPLVALNWAQRLGIQLDVIFSDSLSLLPKYSVNILVLSLRAEESLNQSLSSAKMPEDVSYQGPLSDDSKNIREGGEYDEEYYEEDGGDYEDHEAENPVDPNEKEVEPE